MLEGKRISDRYKVLEIIGGGGMSNVYLAHDMILNRDVAIKVLRYDFTNEAELHRRFQREALSVTSLTHPNIVSIYDVGDDQDLHYIVMEYVKGKTLKQYIQENSPVSPAKSVQIMKQLTSAIAHAHENGIIHRDIKPQNILMDENGNVKVTDFGIAMTLSATSFTQTNSVLGTVHYLSPEQARGGTATKKSDIYALGIVLYELLTGELPFSGESAVSIALKHLQSETPSVRKLNATIPQSLENVVLKATAKDPLHRYESVEAMNKDLQTVLSIERINESKFVVPIDEEATKAIPIIKEKLGRPIIEKKLEQPVKKQQDNKKQEKKEKAKDKGRKKWSIIGASVGAFIILFFILFFTTDLFSPKKIEIPDLKNVELEEGVKQLEELGFVIGKKDERYNEEVKEGFIIETDPSAGKSRVKGTKIDVIVSLGAEVVEMDDYTGKDVDQVVEMLKDNDYLDVEVVEQYSSESEGTIIDQEPAAGEEIIPQETKVVLTVSQGVQMGKVSNLKGYNESALDEYARTSGFKINVAQQEYSDSVPKGNVISQSPEAGTKLEIGSTIDVVVSKGPKEKKVKLYNKIISIPYEPFSEGEEQIVRIYIQDKKNTMAEPYEELKITDDTSYQIRLEIEEGQKAAYRIDRDSIVIAEETISYDSLK